MENIANQLSHLKSYSYTKNDFNKKESKLTGQVIFWSKPNLVGLEKHLSSDISSWQLKEIKNQKQPIVNLTASFGPVWLLIPNLYGNENEIQGHEGKLATSAFSRARDLAGQWLRLLSDRENDKIEFKFIGSSQEEIFGALVGLQLARYQFLPVLQLKPKKDLGIFFNREKGEITKVIYDRANAYALGQNIARHLANLPANLLNPLSMSSAIKKYFTGAKGVFVKIWSPDELKAEGLGLLYGVGQGAEEGSRLVQIKIRKGKKKPVALVGKGITFDTGGLDIKPASGMRLMKKDMSGSAVLAGLAAYISDANLNINVDFYLALAENAVSETATRPGDIHKALNGKLVEIHNTDAEGRLAMADALYLAATQKGKDEPEYLLDCSTLTGAMRVAVGTDVAGYFSNNDKLAKDLEKSAARAGEMIWRMPLIKKYFKSYSSKYADFMNASDSPFGGAITAALFLEKFIDKAKWAHFDMMAWNASPDGALSEGSNAQTFPVLAEFLNARQ